MNRDTFTLLHIEDNPGDAFLLESVLRDQPSTFHITHKTCLLDGLKWLFHNEAHLVLVDLGLPDSKGLDAVSKILAIKNVCLIVLTGMDNFEIAKQAMAIGAQDYINKNDLNPQLIYKTLIFSYKRSILEKNLTLTEELVRKLSLIAQETINGCLITDKHGKISWFNKAFERLTGYTEAELMGKKPGEILQGKDSSKKVIKIMADAVDKASAFDVEIVNYKKSGEPFYVAIQSQPMFNENGSLEGFFSLQTDITELKIKNSEIEEGKKRLDLALNAAFLGILDLDLTSDFIKTEGKFFEIIEYKEDEIELTWDFITSQLAFPMDKVYLNDLRDQILKGKVESLDVKFRIISKSQKIKWIDLKGTVYFKKKKPYRIILVLKEITDKIESDRELMSATINAQENERSRISLDIHDGLQQTLITAQLNLQGSRLTNETDKINLERFEKGMEYLNKGLNETRGIAHQLMPRVIKDFGLGEAIKDLILGLQDEMEIDFYDNQNNTRLSEDIELNLFRITQEAITNALKHAHASSIHIQKIHTEGIFTFSIEDNGRGFDYANTVKSSGLLSIQNRSNAIGGTCEIVSRPGEGTLILIEIPC